MVTGIFNLLESLPAPPGGLPPVLFYGVLLVLGVFVLAGLCFKPIIMQAMGETPSFSELDTNKVPQLNTQLFDHLTRELEALGFQRVADITNPAGRAAFDTTEGKKPVPGSPGLNRIFFHPVELCGAEIYQFFPQGGQPTPVHTSVFSEMEEGWDITTSNRRPEALMIALARPRGLRSVHSGYTPQQLLEAHLGLRSQVCSKLGIRPRELSTVAEYEARERRAMEGHRGVLRGKNSFAFLLEVMRLSRKPQLVWLGDFAGR